MTLNPFEGLPSGYHPRATSDTTDRLWFKRYLVAAGTAPHPCPRCDRPVYAVETAPAGVGVSSYDGSPIPYEATQIAIDCDADVAGTPPTDTAPGSGISHTMLCELTRPLPPVPPAKLATIPRTQEPQ